MGLQVILLHNNEKISATNHRGVLIPLNNKINLEYAKFVLEPLFRRSKKGQIGGDGKSNEYTALPPFMVENIKFSLPIDEDGNIDIGKQNEFVEKLSSVTELNTKIENYKKQIEELNIEIHDEYSYKLIKVKEIFEILGEANLTKAYINTRKGNYPVYSGQIENGGIFGYIDTYKYDETILTWVTYGNSGHILKREGKFNIGRNNCGLRPLSNLIDLDYFRFVAEPIFIENVKGEKQKSLPQTFVKEIEIPVPVKESGGFDLLTQQRIAEKHRKVENIKKEFLRS
jgi:restriction endonuclease S subunit